MTHHLLKSTQCGTSLLINHAVSQQNYIRWTLSAETLFWSSHSRVMKHKSWTSNSLLLLVENIYSIPVRALCLEPTANIGYIEEFNIRDLEELPTSAFRFTIELETDSSQPMHPEQGTEKIVNTFVEVGPSSEEHPAPFAYFATVRFANRAQGWFKLKAKLWYNDQVCIESHSSTFMLNNPRMKKHSALQHYPSEYVKFMQLCSILVDEEIVRSGTVLGYRPELIQQLKDDSLQFFPNKLGTKRHYIPRVSGGCQFKFKFCK
jgi:hypothetical protein